MTSNTFRHSERSAAESKNPCAKRVRRRRTGACPRQCLRRAGLTRFQSSRRADAGHNLPPFVWRTGATALIQSFPIPTRSGTAIRPPIQGQPIPPLSSPLFFSHHGEIHPSRCVRLSRTTKRPAHRRTQPPWTSSPNFPISAASSPHPNQRHRPSRPILVSPPISCPQPSNPGSTTPPPLPASRRSWSPCPSSVALAASSATASASNSNPAGPNTHPSGSPSSPSPAPAKSPALVAARRPFDLLHTNPRRWQQAGTDPLSPHSSPPRRHGRSCRPPPVQRPHSSSAMN